NNHSHRQEWLYRNEELYAGNRLSYDRCHSRDAVAGNGWSCVFGDIWTDKRRRLDHFQRDRHIAERGEFFEWCIVGNSARNGQLSDNRDGDRSERLQGFQRLYGGHSLSSYHVEPRQRTDGCHKRSIWPGELQSNGRLWDYCIPQHRHARRADPFDGRGSFWDAYHIRDVPDYSDSH